MKIKNMSKRAISVFLSLMMCVSLLQVPAFAVTEPQYDEFGNLITTENAAPVESETPVVTEPVVPETPVVPEDDAVVGNNTPDEGNGNNANTPDEGTGDNTNTPDEGNGDNANTPDEGNGEDTNSPDEGNGDNANTPDEGSGDNTNSPDEGSGDDTNTPDEGNGNDTNSSNEVNGDDTNSSDEANGDDTNNPSESADPEEDDSSDVIATDVQLFTLESTAGIVVKTIDELRNAIAVADDSETEISLGDDIDFSGPTGIMIGSSKNIALNLCGFDITATNLDSDKKDSKGNPIYDNVFNVEGTLTINGEGTIKGDTVDNVIGVAKSGNLTINGGTITSENSNRGVFSFGTVNMTGGEISGNKSTAIGGGMYIAGGKLDMSGGTIKGNSAKNGGGIYVKNHSSGQFEDNASVNISGTADISGNSSENGGGIYVENSTLTMDGGTISNNTVTGSGKTNIGGASFPDFVDSSGGGVYVNGGNFIMNDGTISDNTANSTPPDNSTTRKKDWWSRGGGVYVAKSSNKQAGTLTLNGGTIEKNAADEGGGIFVERGHANAINKFNMDGGTVNENVATTGEGGGIYIRGNGEIKRGYITNNVTRTTSDLGGGGVYVEVDGVLNIMQALVTENFAKGLGGGLAACVHGKTSVVDVDNGAAIFGNENEGTGYVNDPYQEQGADCDFIDAHSLWKTSDKYGFGENQSDIFAASDAMRTNAQGTAGIMVGNTMLGGELANWIGTTLTHVDNETDSDVTETGKIKQSGGLVDYTSYLKWNDINKKNNGTVTSDRLLSLKANPSSLLTADDENVGVVISGNRSENTHGGGIANNGVLTFGDIKGEHFNSNAPELNVDKTLAPTEGSEGRPLEDKEFTFELNGFTTNAEDKTETITDTFTGNNDVDETNTATGKATLSVPKEYFNKENATKTESTENGTVYTYTFYATEQKGGNLTITYDETKYLVTVTVTETKISQAIGHDVVTTTNFEISDPVIQVAVKGADGTLTWENANDGIAFVNKYTKPEEPILPTPLVAYDPLELTIKKVFSVVGGEAPTEGEFNFKAEGEEFNANASISLKELHENDNTADTTLTAGVKFDDDGKMMGYDFTVSELDEEMANVTYSKHSYHVSLKVDQKSDDDGITHYFYVPTITHYDENGNVVNDDVATDIANNILTFTNVFKPTTPPTDTDSENPGPDPEEPTTPPTTPDRPSRPTPPPTPEEPTIDIPDDDVPLAPAPEEPEVSIPDEDVPLAGEPPLVELPEPEVPLAPMPPETTTIPDPEVPLAGVPQTGDNASGFYALMALAACGLVVLNLRKKENEI